MQATEMKEWQIKENSTFEDIHTVSREPFDVWSLFDAVSYAVNNNFDSIIFSTTKHFLHEKSAFQGLKLFD